MVLRPSWVAGARPAGSSSRWSDMAWQQRALGAAVRGGAPAQAAAAGEGCANVCGALWGGPARLRHLRPPPQQRRWGSYPTTGAGVDAQKMAAAAGFSFVHYQALYLRSGCGLAIAHRTICTFVAAQQHPSGVRCCGVSIPQTTYGARSATSLCHTVWPIHMYWQRPRAGCAIHMYCALCQPFASASASRQPWAPHCKCRNQRDRRTLFPEANPFTRRGRRFLLPGTLGWQGQTAMLTAARRLRA
jgi:hypothetical protein